MSNTKSIALSTTSVIFVDGSRLLLQDIQRDDAGSIVRGKILNGRSTFVVEGDEHFFKDGQTIVTRYPAVPIVEIRVPDRGILDGVDSRSYYLYYNEIILWAQKKLDSRDQDSIEPASVQQREKRYETDVRSDDDEFPSLPSKVRFVITEKDAIEIARLSALVVENKLYKLERFDSGASWLEGDDPDEFVEARTDVETLNVSGDEFWFSCYLKHTSVKILSERISISELKESFGIKDVVKEVGVQAAMQAPRVLVVVSGGIVDPISDEGVDVEVFDWDNYIDDPNGTGGVSANFADLAKTVGVPVGEHSRSENRPGDI